MKNFDLTIHYLQEINLYMFTQILYTFIEYPTPDSFQYYIQINNLQIVHCFIAYMYIIYIICTAFCTCIYTLKISTVQVRSIFTKRTFQK